MPHSVPSGMSHARPVIGITPDVSESGGRVKFDVAAAYADHVARAGGVPFVLVPATELIPDQLARCDGFVLTGGDDPRTEPFGVPTHPLAKPMHPRRQMYETALLEALGARPRTPVLGVCLGMQMLALVNGGRLDQRLADSRPDAERHWDSEHPVRPAPGAEGAYGLPWSGTVASKHKQAIVDPGRLRVLALSDDGVIEAVADPACPFRVGVQWHPERTAGESTGSGVLAALVRASGLHQPA